MMKSRGIENDKKHMMGISHHGSECEGVGSRDAQVKSAGHARVRLRGDANGST